MRSFGKTPISAVALAALVQFCPAPFLAMPGAVVASLGAISSAVSTASSVTGGVSAAISASQSHGKNTGPIRREVKHQAPDPNQQAWNDCHSQLRSADVTYSGPSTGNVRVQSIPPACMALVKVITGQFDRGNPVPEDADSVVFHNLSDDDIRAIQNALDAHPSSKKLREKGGEH